MTARHKLSLCCVLLAIHPPFLFTKLFAVKTEGLLYHPSLSTTSMPLLPKVRCCRPKKFGRLPEGLPHHYPSLAPTLPKPHYPTLSTTFLPPLSKGGGLTARHKLSLCCIFTCDTSAFFIHQTFCRQDGGIAIPPFAQHHIYASLVKGEVLSPEKIRATTGGIAHHYPSLAPTLPKPHRPSLSTTFLAPLPKGAGLRQGYFLL